MSLVERVLLGPGPSNPYPETTVALAAPVLGQSLGLELFAEEGHRLPPLTSVVPDGVGGTKVRAQPLERFSIEIGGGVGAYAHTVWTIGRMGPRARPGNVLLLLGALAEVPGR